MEQLLEMIQNFITTNWGTILATLSFGISGYFAWQKLTHKITLSYQVNAGSYADEQINKLVISNRRDRTVSIWSIDAVINNDIIFEVYKPQAPLILEHGESISMSPEKYSFLTLEGDHFKAELLRGKIDFYANLGNKIVKCSPEQITGNNNHKSLRRASKTSRIIDGHLYDESVNFILIYYFDGAKRLAFFEDNGFIGNEWNKTPNHMGARDYSADDIMKMLELYGYAEMFTNYVCLEFNTDENKFNVAFKKEPKIT